MIIEAIVSISLISLSILRHPTWFCIIVVTSSPESCQYRDGGTYKHTCFICTTHTLHVFMTSMSMFTWQFHVLAVYGKKLRLKDTNSFDFIVVIRLRHLNQNDSTNFWINIWINIWRNYKTNKPPLRQIDTPNKDENEISHIPIQSTDMLSSTGWQYRDSKELRGCCDVRHQSNSFDIYNGCLSLVNG